MADSLDIAQVARLTGLTSRALRFYESRGLIRPLRSASGRRHYGPAELERLHQILALKRTGLSLAQIERLTAGRTLDLRALVTTQIDALDAQSEEIGKARALLTNILSRIERSEPIDVATFCSLIRNGELTMSQEKGAEIRARYMTPEQMAEYDRLKDQVEPGFDFAAFKARFMDLQARIKAALPMDPASPEGQAFLDEWKDLAKPWTEAASPAMREGFRNLYAHFDDWKDEVETFWDRDAFRFHQDAAKARFQLQWTELQKRYMTPEQFEAVQQTKLPADHDPFAHGMKWRELNERVKAALPLDAASPEAQSLLDEHLALAEPFLSAASLEAKEGMRDFYDHVEEWEGESFVPVEAKVIRFFQQAAKARGKESA